MKKLFVGIVIILFGVNAMGAIKPPIQNFYGKEGLYQQDVINENNFQYEYESYCPGRTVFCGKNPTCSHRK